MPERAKQTRSIIRSNVRLGRPLFGHHNVDQKKPITYEAGRTRLPEVSHNAGSPGTTGGYGTREACSPGPRLRTSPVASHNAGSPGTTDTYGTREAQDVAEGVPDRWVARHDRRLWDMRGQLASRGPTTLPAGLVQAQRSPNEGPAALEHVTSDRHAELGSE